MTATPLERARFYVSNYRIPFPYLCDPQYRVRREWSLERRSHSLARYAAKFYEGSKLEFAPDGFEKVAPPSLRELPSVLADDDMGFYIIDKHGVVRYSLAGSYVVEARRDRSPAMRRSSAS